MTGAVIPLGPAADRTDRQEQAARSLARRLGNALAATDDPHTSPRLYDDQLLEAVEAARTHGASLGWVVAALQREAHERGWL